MYTCFEIAYTGIA